MTRLLSLSLVAALTVVAAQSAAAFDTVGSYIVPADLPAFEGELTQLRWTSEILEYEGPPSGSNFRLRLDFHFLDLEGDLGACPGLTTAIQNLTHNFEDDAVGSAPSVPGLNLYFSGFLTNKLDGVRLDANPQVFPRFGRVFENIDALGFTGNNVYNRDTLGAPSPSDPLLVHWSVRRVGFETNPPGELTKDLNGNWVPLVGTYAVWKVQAEIEGTLHNVATYYLPADYCSRARPNQPFLLTQEHFEINGGQLDARRSKVRYSDFRVFDGTALHDLARWKIIYRIDDEHGNQDNRFGWIEQGDSLLSVCGDASYVDDAQRDPGYHFFLDLDYEAYPDNRPGSGGAASPYPLVFTGEESTLNGSETFLGPVYVEPAVFFPYAQQEVGRGFIALHPTSTAIGGSEAAAAARYTADETGVYRFVGAFARANNFQFAGDGVQVMVIEDTDTAAPLFSASISADHVVDPQSPFSGTGVAPFDVTRSLQAGESVRFAAFAGPPGTQNASFDFTAFRVAVSRDPETLKIVSIASEDGWTLESGETTNQGGSRNSDASNDEAIRIGDNNGDKQYRSVLSFDTALIPDTATVVGATLTLRDGGIKGDTSGFGTAWVDARTGWFGATSSLANADFQEAATATQVGSLTDGGATTTSTLNAAGLAAVNKTGNTQLKIYFGLDDNDDNSNDYLGYYSANSSTASNRPTLTIQYILP